MLEIVRPRRLSRIDGHKPDELFGRALHEGCDVIVRNVQPCFQAAQSKANGPIAWLHGLQVRLELDADLDFRAPNRSPKIVEKDLVNVRGNIPRMGMNIDDHA